MTMSTIKLQTKNSFSKMYGHILYNLLSVPIGLSPDQNWPLTGNTSKMSTDKLLIFEVVISHHILFGIKGRCIYINITG